MYLPALKCYNYKGISISPTRKVGYMVQHVVYFYHYFGTYRQSREYSIYEQNMHNIFSQHTHTYPPGRTENVLMTLMIKKIIMFSSPNLSLPFKVLGLSHIKYMAVWFG